VTAEDERRAGDLMIAAQRGDADAYAALLTMLVPVTRRYALCRVGPRPCVEDIVQETLVAVHRARHTYDARRPFAPWYYAVAASRLIDVMRREQRVARREEGRDVLPDPRPALATPAARGAAIDMDQVRAALEALPVRQREIVTALKIRQESVREVGARLGMRESAVKVAAHRAYRKLRQMLAGVGR
jgi:RNA polymerase sigma-70 factor (ECF subfamily)